MVGVRRFDENQLIDRAMEVFWRRGWEATTMADLADAAGVQRGSLYNAYGSKETLLVKALERYGARWRDRAVAALADPGPRRAMAGFLESHIARMSDPANPPGCLVTGVCMEPIDDRPGLRETVRAQFEATEAALEAYFVRALEAGTLGASHQHPRALARFFVATSRAMAVMHRAHGGDLEVVRDVARTALHALKAPG